MLRARRDTGASATERTVGPRARGASDVRRKRPPHSRVPVICLVVYLALWTLLAIHPHDRGAWVLENLIPLIGVPVAVTRFGRFRFSNRAYVQATIFLLLHAIGSHYTYSLTPVGHWIADVFATSRNHYDRVVHFAFGLLMLAPCRELFFRPPAHMPETRQLALAVALIAAFSTAYELLEWFTAIVVDPSAGNAFLGTQGDVWDAQKDTTLACLGAAIAASAEAAWRAVRVK